MSYSTPHDQVLADPIVHSGPLGIFIDVDLLAGRTESDKVIEAIKLLEEKEIPESPLQSAVLLVSGELASGLVNEIIEAGALVLDKSAVGYSQTGGDMGESVKRWIGEKGLEPLDPPDITPEDEESLAAYTSPPYELAEEDYDRLIERWQQSPDDPKFMD